MTTTPAVPETNPAEQSVTKRDPTKVDPSTQFDTTRCWMRVAVVIAIALILMAELDRLIGAVLSPDGVGHSLTAVIGPLAFTQGEAWEAWSSSKGLRAHVGTWIVFSVVLDLFFIATYSWVFIRFIQTYADPANWGNPLSQQPRSWFSSLVAGLRDAWKAVRRREEGGAIHATTRMLRVLLGLLFIEMIEGVLLVVGATKLQGVGGPAKWVAIAIAFLATAKWLAVVVLAVMVACNRWMRAALGKAFRRGWQAVWLHRLSAVPVALLAMPTRLASPHRSSSK